MCVKRKLIVWKICECETFFIAYFRVLGKLQTCVTRQCESVLTINLQPHTDSHIHTDSHTHTQANRAHSHGRTLVPLLFELCICSSCRGNSNNKIDLLPRIMCSTFIYYAAFIYNYCCCCVFVCMSGVGQVIINIVGVQIIMFGC